MDAMSPTLTPAEGVAAEIRAEMGRQRKSHADMAASLGMSRRSWARRAKGEVPFDVEELHRVAVVLGVPLTDFLPAPIEAAS